MGVHGLWRLLDASGKPVPLETLEGKVLAIDVSIWIHQVLQGYQDRRGSVVPNAHLLGLFHRICKLLYFKIKPVFVFDGGVPMLKKNTIASRKKQKAIAATKAQQMKHELIQNLIKHTAVKGVLALGSGEKQPASSQASSSWKNSSVAPDMFKLPSMPVSNESLSDEMLDDYEDYDSDTSPELSPRKQSRWIGNIHNVDVTSADFKALPPDVRYDVLTDLKETRKQNSWGRLHEMPDVSHEFSDFQMKRLLKRRRVQESLEDLEKEMGGKTLTLEELEQMLSEQGIEVDGRDKAYRVASDSTTRLVFINDPKGLKKSSTSELSVDEKNFSQSSLQSGDSIVSRNFDNHDTTIVETTESLIADINEYDLDSDWESDSEIMITEKSSVKPSTLLSKKSFGKQRLNPALAYMLEHAGIAEDQIIALVKGKTAVVQKSCNDNSETRDDNERSIKRTALFISPEKVFGNDEESNIQASSSKCISDFDNLLLQVPNVCDIEPVREFIPVERSNVNLPFKIDDTIISKPQTSDSDTDSDLVEINDVPIPEIMSNALEIVVKSDEIPENDIFADVFAKESQDISDISAQENSSINDSTASSSFRVIEEISSTIEVEIAPTVCESSKSDVSSEILVESQNVKSTIDSPIAESMDVYSVASTSRADELSEQVAKFKPQLLKSNQEKLVSMQAQLESEHSDLTENIGKLERQATAVTDQMRMEAQDLLQLFGIPYVVAPMEAEAQCAYLETINLTDGTVTDDSDIWLFGGRCVYKNFFNNNKRVMQYRSNDIEHHFKLTRQQMIQLALLVGSDYTVGVSGIGPVTALEILAAFPTEGDDLLRGLGNFCSWLKTGRSAGPGRATLRTKLRNVEIDRGFPSQAVVQAYLFPTVDESNEPFTWSKPNLTLLADYARQKFGWTKLKFEETMGPVVKKLAESKSQKNITSYFSVDTVPKSIETTMSKRVQKAVRRLANADEQDNNFDEPETSGKQREKKKRRCKGKKKVNDYAIDSINSPIDSMESESESKNDEKLMESGVSIATIESEVVGDGVTKIPKIPNAKNFDEYIPQREKDRANAQKKKLRAIEVFKKSKKVQGRRKKPRRPTSNVTKEAKLSESSDSS